MPDLRAKLACSARSDNALRAGAMLAHEENSNASAYSVCPPRNFCFTDYSTIMNNAARTILTKVCKNRLFQISFWLCFVFWQSECLTVAIIFIGSTRDKNHASTRYWFKPLTIACHRIPEKKRTHQGYNKRSRDLDVSVFSRYGLIKQSKEALPARNCHLGQYPYGCTVLIIVTEPIR